MKSAGDKRKSKRERATTRAKRAALLQMLDGMLAATGGPMTVDEERAADRMLYGDPRGRAKLG